MKNQAYYDKLIAKNGKPKPVGDEMSKLEFALWLLAIGSFLGWLVFEWLVS